MKGIKLKLILLILAICFPIYSSVLSIYKESIEQKNYLKAKSDLSSVAFSRNSSIEEKAEAFELLGDLYYEYAGDIPEAINSYSTALRMNPLSDQLKIKSENIIKIQEKHRNQNVRTIKFLAEMEKAKTITEKHNFIKELQDFIKKYPDFYRIFEINYIIAREYSDMKEYKKADLYYRKVIKDRPAADLKIPVSTFMNLNTKLLIDTNTGLFAKMSISAVIFILVLTFFLSKPWNIRSVKPLIILFSIIIFWIIFYYFSHKFSRPFLKLDSIEISREFVNKMTETSLNSQYIKPGFNYIRPLIYNLLYLICGTFFFALSLRSIKNKLFSGLLVFFFVILFSSGLTADYYIKVLNNKASFYSDGQDVKQILKGKYYFVINDIEHYVLIDPRKYTNINTENITSAAFHEWLMKRIEIENSEKQEKHEK